MSGQEKVSVIVPVYKTEKYLERCVKSILSQTYRDLEVILVDDGSPDESGILCDRLATSDSRLYVIHKSNGGLSSARNTGLEAASGKYVCFVDSDDYIADDYIMTMYALAIQYDADLIKIDYVEVDSDSFSGKTRREPVRYYEGTQVEKAFLDLRVDSACVFLYRKTLIGDTRFPIGKTSEDIPFNFQIFQKARSFVYLPETKYYYYHNPDSISNGPLDKNYMNYLLFRKEIYEHYVGCENDALISSAETLYARAAMGMKARMAFYGIAPNIDEEEYIKELDQVFEEHKKVFFKDQNTAISRKILAILVFYFYPLAKIMRRFIK